MTVAAGSCLAADVAAKAACSTSRPCSSTPARGARDRESLSKKVSYRFWRRAHYLNFAVWTLALVHGLAAGADSTTPWALALYFGAAGAVVGLTVRRVLGPSGLAWAGTAALVAAELVVAFVLCPLRHHSG